MSFHNIHIGSTAGSFEQKIEPIMEIGLPEPGMVSKAIGLYLGIAYPGGPPKRILELFENLMNEAGDFYTNPAFARQVEGEQSSYSLRLGCAHYPHMKLRVATWAGGTRYFFSVDAHDKHVIVPQGHPEYEALAEMRRKNQLVVEAIETAWGEAAIPTFNSCLGDDLMDRENNGRRR